MYRSRSNRTENASHITVQPSADAFVAPSTWEVKQPRSRIDGMERQWLDALNASRDPHLMVERDQIVYANRASAAFFGISERRLLRVRFPDLLLGSNGAAAKDASWDVGGRMFVHVEGTARAVEVVARFVRYRGKRVRLIQLREPSHLADRAVQGVGDLVVEGLWQFDLMAPLSVSSLDAEGLEYALSSARLSHVNARMKNFLRSALGLPEREVLAQDVLTFLGRTFMPAMLEGSLNLDQRTFDVLCNDGSTRHFEVSTRSTIWQNCLVQVAGSCFETTEYVEMERMMVSALEEQREQLGRDLHDGVGQLLTGVQILSSNLARDQSMPEPDVRNHAAKIARMAEEAQLNVRQVYRGLSANHLRHLDLSDALSDLTEFVVTMPEIEGVFQFDGRACVKELDVKLQLYRIAQEATNNALKHARASIMTIRWFEEDGRLVLEVEDNGEGFDVGQTSGRTLGLHSMQYRARLIGGHLRLMTHPGRGTTVRCELPKAAAHA